MVRSTPSWLARVATQASTSLNSCSIWSRVPLRTACASSPSSSTSQATVGATPRKRDKLAAQLTWLANRQILNLPEDRRHDRIVPRNPMSILKFDDGRAMACRIMDLSLSGAALAAEIKPLVGEPVTLGRVQARVVRHLEEGFAIEFVHAQLPETVEDNVSAQ